MSLLIDPYRFAAAASDTFIMPYRQDVMAWSSVDGSGGMTYTRYQTSANLGGGSAAQASTADSDDGDYYEWFVNLEAGTYTVTVIYTKFTNGAICDVLIDGTSIGTFDRYNLTANVNNVVTFAGVAVTAGNHTLRIAANGKAGSSSDYVIDVQAVTLHRTGA